VVVRFGIDCENFCGLGVGARVTVIMSSGVGAGVGEDVGVEVS